jgi:hypothetical protein
MHDEPLSLSRFDINHKSQSLSSSFTWTLGEMSSISNRAAKIALCASIFDRKIDSPICVYGRVGAVKLEALVECNYLWNILQYSHRPLLVDTLFYSIL